MTMDWRSMYWVFFAVGVSGAILGLGLLLRATKRPRSSTIAAIAVALVLAGLAGTIIAATAGPAGSGHNMMGMDGMAGMMANRPDVRSAPAPSPGAPTRIFTAAEFSFSPTEVRLPAGATVNVELRNAGDIFHTFTVTALNLEVEANGGETASGALRIDRPGTYEFVCTVPGHAQAGMRGRLIVR